MPANTERTPFSCEFSSKSKLNQLLKAHTGEMHFFLQSVWQSSRDLKNMTIHIAETPHIRKVCWEFFMNIVWKTIGQLILKTLFYYDIYI